MRNAYHECLPVWKDLLAQGLAEDDWQQDWTTLGALSSPDQKARAKIISKDTGIWAASPLIDLLGEYGISAKTKFRDGARLRKGDLICEWNGPARMILAVERPFLNLASYVSGIATRTAELVSRVRKACPKDTPRITSTRKTLPRYRDLAIAGVIAGGGHPHRTSLSGGVLIKENHIVTAGGIRAAIEGARRVAPHLLKIEVEVRNLEELDQALSANADIIMLDNFKPVEVARALKSVEKSGHRPLIEVSGGLNEENIARYAMPGVHVLSVGSLTHSVRALDLSLLFTV